MPTNIVDLGGNLLFLYILIKFDQYVKKTSQFSLTKILVVYFEISQPAQESIYFIYIPFQIEI